MLAGGPNAGGSESPHKQGSREWVDTTITGQGDVSEDLQHIGDNGNDKVYSI